MQNTAYSIEIALTFDDAPKGDSKFFNQIQRAHAIIETLEEKKIKQVAFFSNGFNKKGYEILKLYSDAGHIIANHSYAHLDSYDPNISSEDFIKDIEKQDNLIKTFKTYKKWFRYPYLKQSRVKNGENCKIIEKYLDKEKYFKAYVTIETFDWYFNKLLQENIDLVSLDTIKKKYINAIYEGIIFYDNLSKKLLDRSIKHVLLLHENDINALFLSDLINYLQLKGLKIINIADAYGDDIRIYNNIKNSQRILRAIAIHKGYKGKIASDFEDLNYINKYLKNDE